MALITLPRQLTVDVNGEPRVGAKLSVYDAGTNNTRAVYTTKDFSVPLSQPVQSMEGGIFPAIYVNPTSGDFKLVIQDADGATIYTEDNIPAQLGATDIDLAGVADESTNVAILDSLKRTAAEISAGVTPANYAYAPDRGYDVRRSGVTLDGSTDDTTAFSNACQACNGKLYIPKGTIKLTSQVSIPAGTDVVCDAGATINASGVGYSALRALGSITIAGLTMTRADFAQNTSYKAIHADNSLGVLAQNTRIIVRDCTLTGFDIGIYVDGGASQNVEYVEVSGSHIVINTLGTAGGSSVRPTVSCNNVKEVVIRDNPLLDASDDNDAVNNIYTIGCEKVTVRNNRLLNGIATKILSSVNNGCKQVVITGNRIYNAQYIYFQADAAPIEVIDISGNYFDAPNTQLATPAVIVFETTAASITNDAFASVTCRGNTFKDVPHSIYLPNMSSGKTFGSMTCEGNTYLNTSTASAGTYGIVSNGGAGTYRAFSAANEVVIGNSNTRAYVQATLGFGLTNFAGIVESGCSNVRTAVNQGSYTGTLVNGVAGAVTGTISWTERDGIVTLYIPTINDTSSSTAQKQITGTVPTIIKPTTVQRGIGLCLDSGTGKISIIQIETSGTLTLFNALSTTFTGSGSCGTSACTITYRTTS